MSSKSQPFPGVWKQIDLKKVTIIWVLVFWGLSFVGQINYDSWRRYSPPKLSGVDYNVYIEPQPLSPTLAKAVSFGSTEFLADYYWLTLIQYYGGGTPNGKYRKLAELFSLVTDLSPKFQQAYQTGLIILPGEGFPDQAIQLGEKGKNNLPDSWEMPYYTGLVYHIYKKDYVSAAKEFQIAATKKDAPPITQYFAGIYYKEADQRQLAYQIFKTVHDTTKDDFVRERSGKQLLHLEMIFFLEDAATKYRQQFGRYPSTLQDLVTKQFIKEVPVSPLGVNFVIDPHNGTVSESRK
ncbi:MAG: hypothetical protein Q7K33_00745 [Candidatus Berkelbacteria bacterium]|nr:hypothetical protein [Candidatus Berkelbacteria bacterium]